MRIAQNIPLVLFAAAFLPGSGLSQSLAPVPARLVPGYETIREDTLRADLTFLASDALEGRMSLQPGDKTAVEWIASEFAKAGLEPALGGSYLQPALPVRTAGDENGRDPGASNGRRSRKKAAASLSVPS